MDSLLLLGIIHEIETHCIGGEVHKIRSLEQLSVEICLRTPSANRRIILSWHGQLGRLQLTESPWTMEKQESHVCQMLKKHLLGAVLESIEVIPGDRMPTFHFRQRRREVIHPSMTCQFFGTFTNIWLWNRDNGFILDRARHTNQLIHHIEELRGPEKTENNIPLSTDEQTRNTFLQILRQTPEEKYPDTIRHHYRFIGSLLAREISRMVTVNFSGKEGTHEICREEKLKQPPPEQLWDKFVIILNAIESHRWFPVLVTEMDSAGVTSLPGILAIQPAVDDRYQPCSSFAEACDLFYSWKQMDMFRESLQQRLCSHFNDEMKRLDRIIANLVREQEETTHLERFRKYGDLILANLSQIDKGLQSLTLPDIIDDQEDILITIPMDAARSPVENAQRYYREASRLRRRAAILNQRLSETQGQRVKLEREYDQIIHNPDIDQLKKRAAELFDVRSKDISSPRNIPRARDKKSVRQPFYRFISSDGWTILVGRSSKDNDALTFGEAKPDDFWLHAREGAGSHVIVKNTRKAPALPSRTLVESAMLAAHYSKLKKDPAIDIKVTRKKYVRKPKGFPPGLVLVEREKNFRVDMDETILNELFSRRQD